MSRNVHQQRTQKNKEICQQTKAEETYLYFIPILLLRIRYSSIFHRRFKKIPSIYY